MVKHKAKRFHTDVVHVDEQGSCSWERSFSFLSNNPLNDRALILVYAEVPAADAKKLKALQRLSISRSPYSAAVSAAAAVDIGSQAGEEVDGEQGAVCVGSLFLNLRDMIVEEELLKGEEEAAGTAVTKWLGLHEQHLEAHGACPQLQVRVRVMLSEPMTVTEVHLDTEARRTQRLLLALKQTIANEDEEDDTESTFVTMVDERSLSESDEDCTDASVSPSGPLHIRRSTVAAHSGRLLSATAEDELPDPVSRDPSSDNLVAVLSPRSAGKIPTTTMTLPVVGSPPTFA